jgi:glucokinase
MMVTDVSSSGASASSTAGPLVVGVDFGGTQIRAALAQDGKILTRVGYLTHSEEGFEPVLARLKESVRQTLTLGNVTLSQISGIGFCAPGPIDSQTGILYDPPNLHSWHNVPIKQLLEDEFRVPVHVGNDANLAALGEYMYGAGRGLSDMIYVTVSTGIGGGIVIGGKILEGVSGTAGEVGHMTVDMHGPVCNCGNIGCVEALASGTAIARQAAAAIAAGRGSGILAQLPAYQADPSKDIAGRSQAELQTAPPLHLALEVDARLVVKAAEAGDPVAQQIISDAATAIGVAMVNLVHLFNPQMIAIGGGVAKAGELLFGPIRRLVRERAFRVPGQAVQIVPAQLGENVGLVGAAAFVIYHQTGE